MSDPFVGEIRMVAFNYAPRGWAACDGQLMSIPQNTALFSLLGTTYGGDGKATFGLPNLKGRVPMHEGNAHPLGESAGSAQVTLLNAEIPAHTHAVTGSTGPRLATAPAGAVLSDGDAYAPTPANGGSLAPSAVGAQGGAQPHENRQPYLSVMFVIAIQGIYPSRG